MAQCKDLQFVLPVGFQPASGCFVSFVPTSPDYSSSAPWSAETLETVGVCAYGVCVCVCVMCGVHVWCTCVHAWCVRVCVCDVWWVCMCVCV